MQERILWSSATRFHNWRDNGFPFQLLEQAVSAGIIGPIEWVEPDWDSPRQSIQINNLNRLGFELFQLIPPNVETVCLLAGGSQPQPWKMSMYLPLFSPQEQRVEGYCLIKIIFEGIKFKNLERSSGLIKNFLATHSSENTEFAFIHPYLRWNSLDDSIYKSPVTFRPMFSGIYWANFLGSEHLNLFDLQQLKSISAYWVEWMDENRGLFLLVTPNLEDAETQSVEEEMQRLTELFRKARQ